MSDIDFPAEHDGCFITREHARDLLAFAAGYAMNYPTDFKGVGKVAKHLSCLAAFVAESSPNELRSDVGGFEVRLDPRATRLLALLRALPLGDAAIALANPKVAAMLDLYTCPESCAAIVASCKTET